MDFPLETGFNGGMNTQIISEQGPLRVEERYYLPTPVDSRRQGPGDQAFRRFPAERGSRASSGPRAAYQGGQVYLFSSATGGCGTSTAAALFASYLSVGGERIILMDLDLSRGGMDVLLGLEQEEGLRWSQVKAPLGMIDGLALTNELIQWDGCPLLSADPWRGSPHQWWEIAAVIRALCDYADAVVCDCGTNLAIIRGLQTYLEGTRSDSSQAKDWYQIWDRVGNRTHIAVALVVDLTVLGLMRAQGAASRLSGRSQALNLALLGILPVAASLEARRGFAQRRKRSQGGKGMVSAQEASDHLGQPIYGPLRPDRGLDLSIRQGRGLEDAPREYERIFADLEEGLSSSSPALSGGHHDLAPRTA